MTTITLSYLQSSDRMASCLTRRQAKEQGVEVECIDIEELGIRIKKARTARRFLDKAPAYPVCPLTGEPVKRGSLTSAAKHLYEREAIEAYMKDPSNVTDPATGIHLVTRKLVHLADSQIADFHSSSFHYLFDRIFALEYSRVMTSAEFRMFQDAWRRMANFPSRARQIYLDDIRPLIKVPDAARQTRGVFVSNEDALSMFSSIPNLTAFLGNENHGWASNLFVACLYVPNVDPEPYTDKGVRAHGFCYHGLGDTGELRLSNAESIHSHSF